MRSRSESCCNGERTRGAPAPAAFFGVFGYEGPIEWAQVALFSMTLVVLIAAVPLAVLVLRFPGIAALRVVGLGLIKGAARAEPHPGDVLSFLDEGLPGVDRDEVGLSVA